MLTALGAVRALAAENVDANLASVQALLALPEAKIDLARVKIVVDRMIDPRIDAAATLRQIDAMASEIRATLGVSASSRAKIEALRSFLYEPRSGNSPFQYDMADPNGRKIQNKLLATYLATRRGNCISMPLLFIVLGQRLGIDVTAATAPEHVFVKYRDETGAWFNLETTSGAGFTSDAWFQKNMPMTPQALANGVYMRPLSKRETVAEILVTLMEWHGQEGQDDVRLAVARMVLALYPKNVDAMLHVSAAFYGMRRREFESRYSRPRDVPLLLRPRLNELDENIRHWREEAAALGWREPEQPR